MPPRYMTWGDVVGFGSEHVLWTIIFGFFGGLTIGLTYGTDSQVFGIIAGILIFEIGLVGMAIKAIADGVSFALYHNSNPKNAYAGGSGMPSNKQSSTQVSQHVSRNYRHMFPAFTKICSQLLSKLDYESNPTPIYFENEDVSELILRGIEQPLSLKSSEKTIFVKSMNLHLEKLTPEQVTEFRNSDKFDTYRKVIEYFND